MMMRLADLWNGRLLRFVTICAMTFAVSAAVVDAPVLIRIGNGIAMSVACFVCWAYAAVFYEALFKPVPTRGDYLGCGIFFVSLAIVVMRGQALVARDLGWPQVYNTDWTSLAYAIAIIGGLLHLWAPKAIEGRIPRARWISTGALVGFGFFVTFVAWTAHTTYAPQHTTVELR